MQNRKALSPAEAERRRKLVDELGAIDTARAEAIKKEIREVWMADAKATDLATFLGHRYVAAVTARKMEREADNRKVYKFKGLNWFLKWARLSVKTVEDHVALPDRVGMITEARTGSRSVSVAPLPQSAAAAPGSSLKIAA